MSVMVSVTLPQVAGDTVKLTALAAEGTQPERHYFQEKIDSLEEESHLNQPTAVN